MNYSFDVTEIKRRPNESFCYTESQRQYNNIYLNPLTSASNDKLLSDTM